MKHMCSECVSFMLLTVTEKEMMKQIKVSSKAANIVASATLY